MDDRFETYLHSVLKTPIEEQTEHTSRAAVESLLNRFAGEAAKGITVQHEPQRASEKGAPDFKIKHQGMILGYVEVKTFGEDLEKLAKSDQVKRYRQLSDNILLTNYRQFMWLHGAQKEGPATLIHMHELEGRRPRIPPERIPETANLIAAFFSQPPQGIGRAQQLALALAGRSKLLRDALTRELIRQETQHREGRLFGLLGVFREQVFHELGIAEFADAFAQMLAYGLFLARLNTAEGEEITLENARRHISGSFRLIRELVDFLDVLDAEEYDDMRWIVDEVLSIVNGLDLAAIHEDLSFRQRRAISRKVRAKDEEEHRLFERDPFIYFYEDYLRAYDPAMSKGRGVYYTPPPVVNFIVRAIDDLLTGEFGIADGLADHQRVTVLDFACGTGTFLVEVFQRIFDNIGGPEAGRADLLVRRHITRNLYGFEYLIAPYTIAHLKLSQYLRDKGHPLRQNERLRVYLTNTLEPVEPQKHLLLPELSAEVEAAQGVKDMPILVILGNPPYAGHSKNKGEWITGQVATYREGLPELAKPAQAKWLQDDYVKFIRFAQWKMDRVEEGVVGVITNHSWIDSPTFKGMRKSLMGTFNQIYVLDLHGNAKKKERAPDGGDDQNVFDIEQGVAISLFVKCPGLERGVWHGDLWGRRLEKYQSLADNSRTGIKWTQVSPEAPDWLFKPYDADLARKYRQFWSIPEIFAPMGDPAPGIVTTHDQFAISVTPEEACSKVNQLLATETEAEARRLFRLCSQNQWSYQRAKAELPNINLENAVTPVLYRPFDRRWTVWDRNVAVHRRERVMRHMIEGKNIGLITSRLTKGEIFKHVLVTSEISEVICISPQTSNNGFLFPLYLYHETGQINENISYDFREFINRSYAHHYSAEEILGYIYAALHAPAYRQRYVELLRRDFPRIPFPERAEDFETLSAHGWALVEAHLLRTVPKRGLGDYHGKGSHEVETVRYVPREEAVWINQTQRFAPVSPEVWEFRIGGYQVLDKYLKSRRGRTLSLDEINHLACVADALAFTIDQMQRIDDAYRAAFPEHT